MPENKNILLLGHADHDTTLQLVKANLESKFSARVHTLDTRKLGGNEFISHEITNDLLNTRLSNKKRTLAMNEVEAVWARRWETFVTAREIIEDKDAQYILENTHQHLAGLFHTPGIRWVNHPLVHLQANNKFNQLKFARELGLTIPKTLITHDPDEVIRFYEENHQNIVCKKLSDHPSAEPTKTVLINAGSINLIDSIQYCPAIFQEQIPVYRDIRVIIIGEEVFAAEVDTSQGIDSVDWRVDVSNPWKIHRLEEKIKTRLVQLNQQLGLIYSAVDLRLTPAGNYVYFETNPGGQFMFIEVWTELKIMDALCNFLIQGCN